MNERVRAAGLGASTLLLWMLCGGCPTDVAPVEYIPGQTAPVTVLSDDPEVEVLSPSSNLSIAGGTQVEVNWRAIARTRTAVLNVIVDDDQTPGNESLNEVTIFSNLSIAETSALIDTTRLEQGTYFVGVVMEEVGDIVAFDYASGTLTINQRPDLFFTSPRKNYVFDRTSAITPEFDVSWELDDPDSTNTVDIYLDPDETPNGNEVLLFSSDSQTGDSFTFQLPTDLFDAGVYRLLAQVRDGLNTTEFYSPGSIRLRARLAGVVDLRDMHLPESPISGAVFEGFNPRDNAGSFVANVGDVDSDGFSDFFIMAQFGKPRYDVNVQRTGIGEAYLIYGRQDRFSGVINLNSTGTLYRGEFYMGVPEAPDPIRPSRGITSFTTLSDWDNDGVREMAFGLPFTDSAPLGRFALGPAGNSLAPLDPGGYFRSGAVVVAAGSALRPDLGFPGRNVFGLAQFGTVAHLAQTCPACGAPEATSEEEPCPCEEGFYGPKAPTPPFGCPATWFHQHLVGDTTVADRLGCRFSSAEFGDQFGETVSAWDFDSIVMSAPNRDPFMSILDAPGSVSGAGVISVYFVAVTEGFYPWCNDNSPGANDTVGYPGSVQSVGDRRLPHGGPYHYVMDDILNTPGYYVDPDDSESPCERVIDGRMDTLDWSVRFWSGIPGARLSNAKGLPDLNGDGLLDLAIGAPQANAGGGACYIILGRLRNAMIGGELRLEELTVPMFGSNPDAERIFDGIQIVGAPGERLGQTQDTAGDFNNDGFTDVVIGAPLLANRKGGAGVFFGSRDVINLTQEEIPFMELPERGLGVVFVGEDEGDLAGARVAGTRDIDGDGNDDILIAAPDRSVRMDIDFDGVLEIDRERCGVVYLVYGAPDLATRRTPGGEPGILNLAYIGTEDLPGAMFVGRNSGDHLGAGLGEQGDRAFGIAGGGDVDGDGAGEILLGAARASPRDRARAGEVYLIYGQNN